MLEAVLLASSTAFSFEVVSPPAAERREVRMVAQRILHLAGLTLSPN